MKSTRRKKKFETNTSNRIRLPKQTNDTEEMKDSHFEYDTKVEQ